jgi:citrate lyase beta subunit
VTSRAGARRLRRSLLFVPGDEQRKIEKARRAGADAVILDLEDGVAPEGKVRARDLVAGVLREGSVGGTELVIRVNAPGTPWFEADLEAVVIAGARALMLPKTESAEGLAKVAERLDRLEARPAKGEGASVRLLPLVESASGIARIATLGGASPRVDALCFGHVDFSRDMGLAESDASAGVVLHARCAVAIAARAAQVAAIDSVFLALRDERAFREDVETGTRLGFEGKLCIHPLQAKIVNELLTPSSEQIVYARRVLEAWARARSEGRGVFTLDGRMLDAPLVAIQERVIERARRAGVLRDEDSQEAEAAR